MKKCYHVKVLLREIELRKKKNARYSLRAFAKFLDIAPSTLSRILAGQQELSVSATRKIMKKLDLSDEERLLFIASVAEQKKIRCLDSLKKLTGSAAKDFKFTLESIANMAVKQFSDGCIIHLTNGNKEAILHAKHREGQFDGSRFNTWSTPIICHPVLSPDKPLILNHTDKNDDILGHLNAKSLLSVPVKKGDKKCGAITFFRTDEENKFSEDDVESAMELSSKASYVHDLLNEP